jgi:1-acyl-sn-glycerol-3-phosphate acyltransferase
MKPSFYPPRLNPLLVRFAHTIAPLATRWFYQFQLVVDETDLERVRSLGNVRLLLMPNHPTFQDPVVLFALSSRLGQMFYYLAAYELLNGSLGGVLQRIGVYSIRRGLLDRASVAQTVDLLTQPACRLVIFAEGGCSFQNDIVMPFRSGAIQIAFQAINRMVKQGQSVPDLYVLPVAIKYHYTQDMSQVIQRTLAQLETALQLNAQPAASLYDRLRTVAQRVLIRIEQDYGLYDPEREQQSWNQRILTLREQVLGRCEQQLGIPSNPNEPVRERTYRVEYALKTRADELETGEELATNGVGISDRAFSFALIEKTVRRLLNFDAMYDGYVAENPTPERFLDTLTRLEREVFDIDQPPPKGARQARVKIGQPINLKQAWESYRGDRTGTIDRLTTEIQSSVQENLDALNQLA